MSENKFKWTDEKVIDFVNDYLNIHNISFKYKLENFDLLDNFKKGLRYIDYKTNEQLKNLPLKLTSENPFLCKLLFKYVDENNNIKITKSINILNNDKNLIKFLYIFNDIKPTKFNNGLFLDPEIFLNFLEKSLSKKDFNFIIHLLYNDSILLSNGLFNIELENLNSLFRSLIEFINENNTHLYLKNIYLFKLDDKGNSIETLFEKTYSTSKNI